MIAEPDPAYRAEVLRVAHVHADAEGVGDFQAAYARLSTGGLDLLVTNLRLHANVEGLQLAYVMASAGYSTRALVYGDRVESWITRELQRTGAFYETRSRLPFVLPAYLHAALPVLDRRNPDMRDRRTAYRGGRRSSDVPTMWSRL